MDAGSTGLARWKSRFVRFPGCGFSITWLAVTWGLHCEPDCRRAFIKAPAIWSAISRFIFPRTRTCWAKRWLSWRSEIISERCRRQARWAALGRRHMEEQLRVQIRTDGSHFEQSTSLSRVRARHAFLFYAVLNGGASAESKTKLRAMAEYLRALLGSSGEIPCLGDDDGGRFFSIRGVKSASVRLRKTLATAAALLDEPAFYCEAAAEESSEVAVWWLGPRALEQAPQNWQPWQGAHLFADARVAVVSHDADCSIVDTRAFGWARAGHGHAHALSLVHRRADRDSSD